MSVVELQLINFGIILLLILRNVAVIIFTSEIYHITHTHSHTHWSPVYFFFHTCLFRCVHTGAVHSLSWLFLSSVSCIWAPLLLRRHIRWYEFQLKCRGDVEGCLLWVEGGENHFDPQLALLMWKYRSCLICAASLSRYNWHLMSL